MNHLFNTAAPWKPGQIKRMRRRWGIEPERRLGIYYQNWMWGDDFNKSTWDQGPDLIDLGTFVRAFVRGLDNMPKLGKRPTIVIDFEPAWPWTLYYPYSEKKDFINERVQAAGSLVSAEALHTGYSQAVIAAAIAATRARYRECDVAIYGSVICGQNKPPDDTDRIANDKQQWLNDAADHACPVCYAPDPGATTSGYWTNDVAEGHVDEAQRVKPGEVLAMASVQYDGQWESTKQDGTKRGGIFDPVYWLDYMDRLEKSNKIAFWQTGGDDDQNDQIIEAFDDWASPKAME